MRPEEAYSYAPPYLTSSKEHGVMSPVHIGTSHYFFSREVADSVGKPADQGKRNLSVTYRVTSGSVSWFVMVKCIDTSMGLNPVRRFDHGTRYGDHQTQLSFSTHIKN